MVNFAAAIALAFHTPIALGFRRDDSPSVNFHDPWSLAILLELVEKAPGNVVTGAKLRDRECLATGVSLTK
jgi:hypothetical protein